MGNLVRIVSILLLISLFTATFITAEIKSVKIRADDGDPICLDYFEFTHTGHVSITVSSMSITSLPLTSNISLPDPSRFGFYLVSEEARYRFAYETISCSLDSKFISLLFTLKDLIPNPDLPSSSFNKSYPVTYPNGYSLYFANCIPFSHVTMDIRTELYNIDNNGITKDYLSANITQLPRIYFVLSIIYLSVVVLWILICFKNHKYVHWIHVLMGVLLVTKAVNLFFAAEVQHSVKVTGTRSHRWNVLFFVFHFLNRALLYTLIAVIFDGWSFVKPKAKWFLVIVIPLQVLATFQLSKLAGEAHDFWFMIVETVLYTAIIAPVVISLYWVYETYETKEAANNYLAKFRLFWCFLIVVGVYFFINLVLGVNNNESDLVNRQSIEEEEITILVFYIVMFLMFTPFQKHDYFVMIRGELSKWEFEL